jgi:pentatricopeptide repeat protein
MGTKVVLINALQNNGQTHEAIAAIEELLKEDIPPKEKAILALRIGDIHFTAREYGKASTAFQRVCKMKNASESASAKAMYYLAVCYRQTGYDRIARQCMNRVAKLYPASRWAEESAKTVKGWDFVDAHPSLRNGG